MNFLWRLFTLRTQHHHYALLDNSGICLAFRHCATPPQGSGWVEIDDVCLGWLNRKLPESARTNNGNGPAKGHVRLTN